MKLNEVLATVAADAGLTLPEIDGETSITFDLEDGLVVRAETLEDGDGFCLNAHVADLPDGDRLPLYSLLLEANALGAGAGRAAFGVDHEMGEVTLTQALRDTYQAAEDFMRDFEVFVAHARTWRAQLAEGVAGAESLRFVAGAEGAPAEQHADLPSRGMTRV